MGVRIESGTLTEGQMVCAQKDNGQTVIGKVVSIQNNKDSVEFATENSEVCLKIDNSETNIKYGKDFDDSFLIIPFHSPDEQYLISKYSS